MTNYIGLAVLQRKHFHRTALVFGIMLVVISFTAKSSHRDNIVRLAKSPSPQLLLVPETLSDDAKLNNIVQSPLLQQVRQMSNFQELSVPSSQRCSDQFAMINHEALGLPEAVLKIAMRAYYHARNLGLDSRQLLTVVDYQKPSDQRRLFVFDLHQNKLLFDTYVSHGARSGRRFAKHFSNRIDSLESSLGVILTGKSYEGIMGYSMRLHGLEQKFNSNMFLRDVVMHPAKYATRYFIDKHHEAGKSFGCLAISKKVAKNLIDTIKDGTIIVNYFPSNSWLYHSRFLR